MSLIFFIGALFLGWSLGRNNLSNLFGTAVGTRMISLKTAIILSIIFIFLGAFFSGQATTSSVLRLSELTSVSDAFIVCLSAAVVLELSSRLAIPASIAQTTIGSLIGWNLYSGRDMDLYVIQKMVGSWFIAPFLAAFIGWGVMRLFRTILRRYPISLFTRDAFVRVGLIGAGILASYSLGANNIGTITAPYLSVVEVVPNKLVLIVCLFVALGCWMADKAVIKTVSNGLFPLSPSEAFVVMTGTALTMFLFTSQYLRHMMTLLHFPLFPLVPIPISSTIIGSIVGISLSKGGYGLRFSVLGRIILSWGIVPILSGCICFFIMMGVAE